METIRLFKKCNYTEEDYKFCISKYLENHVGFNVEKEKVSYLKIDNDGIDSLIVILKDDIRRISKDNGGSGVLRQKQWSIFVFSFIDSSIYESFFGTNANKKPIVSPYNQINMDNFEYQPSTTSLYNGKYPEKPYQNAAIKYLLQNFIYLKLRNKYRYLFLNSYVYSVVGVINPKPIIFSTYYYNTNHKFNAVPDHKHVINQKVDINKTTSLIPEVKMELETIEKNYSDMSSLVNAYKGDLPLNPVTSVNFESIKQDIVNHENFIITEGTARTGKTIIAMRLLGLYKEARLIIMNELFYNSLVEIFRIEGILFPTERVICHTQFNRMSEWVSGSKILVVDEAQRLNGVQIDKLLDDNKNNINVFLGDNLQAINWKSDKGIETIEKKLIIRNAHYKKYYFDHSIGISSNVLYSIKYLIYNNAFNNQNINNYDINIFNNEIEFVDKYKNDSTYRKHMATIYMGCKDYNETISGFNRWHVNQIKKYPYYLDTDIKNEVMLTTYELISRELDSVYIYIPNSIYADSDGLHYLNSSLDSYLLNQLYVLFTRAKGEINILCSNSSTYDYLSKKNKKIIKNDKIISTLSKEEKQKSIQLEEKISERGITRLIHFTPKENLDSILKNGIMSIQTMKEKGILYTCNDMERYDNVCDGISLSIQNPNGYLLNKFKRIYGDREYVCLILDPALLYEITDKSGYNLAPRIYCNYNAASRNAERSDYDFNIMFKNSFWAGSWNNTRQFDRVGKEDNETTASQAEILFRETIDPKYILEIKDV